MELFPTKDALYDAAAATIIAALSDAISARGHASAVLTGGSTPGPVYDRLARASLDWRRVMLTLSDERWVEPTHDDSNERLVRTRLLIREAASAGFVGLKYPSPDVETGARAAAEAIAGLFPADLTLLGMGEDGHIASLFPGDPILPYALDPDAERLTVGVATAGLAPHVPRISLTLRALLDSRLILLLATGEGKRALIEQQLSGGVPLPVAAVLTQPEVPVRVLWAA